MSPSAGVRKKRFAMRRVNSPTVQTSRVGVCSASFMASTASARGSRAEAG